ncbi:MAG: D-alanyl-D-alanine carboxypeptidase family protein [Gemmiger sp.]
MKKLLSCAVMMVLAAVLSVPAFATEGYEPDFEVAAESAYIVNTDTNIVVYEKNSEQQLQSASLTKMMTMLLMLQTYEDQLDTVTVTAPGYIYDYLYGKDASNADIWRGETLTLRQLLYAMELPSANEAAYIVADFMGGGDIDAFVTRMNEEAVKVGCTGTVFTDPCGLDEGNLTTARDAYLILRALYRYDAYVEVAGTTSYQMPANSHHESPYTIYATDKMIFPDSSYYRSYTQGGKTGTLGEWQNFAGWHTSNGESYISVVLHSPYSADADAAVKPLPALRETGRLMDWVFKTFTISTALDTTQAITEIPILYSTETDTLLLYPADGMMTLLPADGGGALTDQTFDLPESVAAPIKQGDVVGTVTLSINGQLLGTVDLIAGSDVNRNAVLFTLTRIGEFFSGRYFRLVVLLTVIVVMLYAFLWVSATVMNDPGGKKKKR